MLQILKDRATQVTGLSFERAMAIYLEVCHGCVCVCTYLHSRMGDKRKGIRKEGQRRETETETEAEPNTEKKEK